jgi:hypothetical protein
VSDEFEFHRRMVTSPPGGPWKPITNAIMNAGFHFAINKALLLYEFYAFHALMNLVSVGAKYLGKHACPPS